jgi:thiamine-phosphate pyrophosphorylase
MNKIDFRLYLITDRNLLPPSILCTRIEVLIHGGIKAVQIREKDLSARKLIELVMRIQGLPGKLFVNDRVDIAFATKTNLHLPEQGFSAIEARKILGEKLIGKSTHSLESALRAESEAADFITFGPIYETPSKLQYGKPLGLQKLREVTKAVAVPVFAIGGINPDRAGECIKAGAHGIAVISDLLTADDPKLQVEKYLEVLGSL